MTSSCEVALKFSDSSEVKVISDMEIIKKCSTMMKAMEEKNENQENHDVTTSIEVPFKKEPAEFLLAHILNYITPEDITGDITDAYYQEARAKSIIELIEIMEVANFLGCNGFMACIGFCVARKMDDQSADTIANFLGLEKPAAEENVV